MLFNSFSISSYRSIICTVLYNVILLQRDQLALLEKDIDSLNKDLERNKAESRQNEIKLQERVKQWQEKYAASESENRELKADNERLTFELNQAKQDAAALLKVSRFCNCTKINNGDLFPTLWNFSGVSAGSGVIVYRR